MIKFRKLLDKNSQAGFTIMEMLTVFFIFSIMAVIVGGILVKSLDVERRSFSAQVIQENVLATLELMTKEIRVSRVEDQENNCTTDAPLSQLVLIHPTQGSVVYRLNNGIVERVRGSVTYQVSNSEVVFNTLRFCVTGSTTPLDGEPARVAIITSVSNVFGKHILTVDLQTLVTSRYLINEL